MFNKPSVGWVLLRLAVLQERWDSSSNRIRKFVCAASFLCLVLLLIKM